MFISGRKGIQPALSVPDFRGFVRIGAREAIDLTVVVNPVVGENGTAKLNSICFSWYKGSLFVEILLSRVVVLFL